MTTRIPVLRRGRSAVCAAVLPAVAAMAPAGTALARTAPAYQPVTESRLLHAENDNGWLMYRRAYNSQGYAPFTQIDRGNVDKLKPAFTYKTGLKQGHEGARS